jgi:hypothetical protein
MFGKQFDPSLLSTRQQILYVLQMTEECEEGEGAAGQDWDNG